MIATVDFSTQKIHYQETLPSFNNIGLRRVAFFSDSLYFATSSSTYIKTNFPAMQENPQKNILEAIKFDEKGLIPAIAQDNKTGQILMFAWMNKESINATIKTKFTFFIIESKKLFKKFFYIFI